MDKQVIEAAAKAEYDRVQSVHGTGFMWDQLLPDSRASWMRSAATMVKAADAARAKEVKAAVDNLIFMARRAETDFPGQDEREDELEQERREFLGRLGIDDGETVTEPS